MLLVVPPDLKPALLEQVVKELMVHHDALRMRFVLGESRWLQRNTDICEPVPLLVIDLSAVPMEEQKAVIERIAAELQTTLNLVERPLLRVVMFNFGSDLPSRLLLIIHHLVVDGVSWRILLEDIATAYKQLEQGSRIQLPPKTTSFKNWAIHQRDYGLSPVPQQELDYWLAQYCPDTPLPVDYPDGKQANTEGSTSEISVFLDELLDLIDDKLNTSKNQLRDFLKQKLPDYMVPSVFMILDALPLTPNDKLDRRALPEPNTQLSDSTSFVPPRDTVEQQLQLIWSEVLHLTSVGVQENFFTLGGHSLLAVRLMALIERHFGLNLPLATLFLCPTIEQLASHLRQFPDSLPWSSLVAIQSSGDKRPFFCVPGVGGNVIYLYELARHLGSDQPFYGLQAKGLDGESEPFTKVEDIANHYIEAIQTVQPTGPYLLGGHSFGGVVAFEMAQQLQKMGHEVALLAIIDAVAPIFSQKPNCIDEDDTAYLTDFASYIGYMLSRDLEVSKETLASLTFEEQLHYLKERLSRVNLLPEDAEIRSVRGGVQVYKANWQAHGGYLPLTGSGRSPQL